MSPPAARRHPIPREQGPWRDPSSSRRALRWRTVPPRQPNPMPNGPDQRPSRNRRSRRRPQTSRLPVTEQDEVAELEAARERNDLDIRDLREMSVKELRAVGAQLDIEDPATSRVDDLVGQILQAQSE